MYCKIFIRIWNKYVKHIASNWCISLCTYGNNFFGTFNVNVTHFLEAFCFFDKSIDAFDCFTNFGHFSNDFQMRIEINLHTSMNKINEVREIFLEQWKKPNKINPPATLWKPVRSVLGPSIVSVVSNVCSKNHRNAVQFLQVGRAAYHKTDYRHLHLHKMV